MLSSILKAWIRIFETADENIKLKGRFKWDEEFERGEFERLVFKKNYLLDQLKLLIKLTEKVNNDDLVILHIGI